MHGSTFSLFAGLYTAVTHLQTGTNETVLGLKTSSGCVEKKKREMVDEGHHKLHLAGAHLSQFPEALTIKSPMR